MDQLLEQVSSPVHPLPGTVPWSDTALGGAETWTHSLRTALQLTMDASQPMFLLWGQQCTLVYNAPFAAIADSRHPRAFGAPVATVWPELWRWDSDVFGTGYQGTVVSFMDQHLVAGTAGQWFDFFYTPVRDDDGQVRGVLCSVVDDTRRVQAERAGAERAATEDRIRIAHEAGGIGTFEWFPFTDRIIASNTYRALWGFAPETKLDAGMLAALVDPDDHHFLGTATADNNENPLAYAEFRIRRTDTGERRWLARRGQVIGDGIAATRRYVGVAFDISERKLIEEALASTEHQLRILNETLEHRVIEEIDRRARAEEALHQSQKMEAIGQLTGGVAHDFNNVLHIIGGNLQLLHSHVTDNPLAQKRLDIATAAVVRGAKLSSQLLAFARRQPLQPTVTNLGRLVNNMHDLMRRALGESIRVEAIIADGLWNTLADQSQIENVILNLVINSRDAMDGRGCVSITLDNVALSDTFAAVGEVVPAGDYVLLAVSDDGAGMAPDILQKAFEPFFTTKPEGEGTGLGLSMAYGFVKQSHGHIKIHSKPGEGTTIRIYLPRSHEEEALVQLVKKGPVEGGSETILVVEDDPGVQATVVDTLTTLGYRVLKADDGASALALLKSGVPVDLLFTDVVMPGALRSTDLAHQARMLFPGLAVLFTSGYTQDAIVHGGRLDPGVDLLSKPYHSDQLADKIRASLANVRSDTVSEGAPISEIMATEIAGASVPRTLSILVVEDNHDLCQLVCELLTTFGHMPTPAGSAEEALACIADGTIDVLLTDVRLPGMSGIDLARQVLVLKPQVHVVFASGYGAAVTANVGFPAATLAKPYDIEQLQALLESFSRG